MVFRGTKGKWKIVFTEEVESYLDIAISSQKDDCVAWVYRSSEYKSLNGQANALLISKAPEMLGMLRSVLDLQISNYGSATDTHLDLIGKAKEIEQLIKEATEIN